MAKEKEKKKQKQSKARWPLAYNFWFRAAGVLKFVTAMIFIFFFSIQDNRKNTFTCPWVYNMSLLWNMSIMSLKSITVVNFMCNFPNNSCFLIFQGAKYEYMPCCSKKCHKLFFPKPWNESPQSAKSTVPFGGKKVIKWIASL